MVETSTKIKIATKTKIKNFKIGTYKGALHSGCFFKDI